MKPLDPMTIPLRGTHLIEASAGTGKTRAITNLYVRLLLEPPIPVGAILVVTFTNAATADLRARIRRRLRQTLAAFDSLAAVGDDFLDRLVQERHRLGLADRDRRLLTAALHGFDEAAIFTIHAFCQRMLQENAFESGASFDTELISNEGPLLTEVVQDFWVRELHDAPEALVRHLERPSKLTPRALERLATTVITQRDMQVLPGRDDQLPVEEEHGVAGSGDPLLEARVLALKLDSIDYVREELGRRKQRARLQSFDDLLQHLARALRASGGPALAAMIRRRFRAALIDEFHDTDPIQYEIFRRVYDDSDTALFLIGDPKQAIYAFRGADVFAYIRAKRDVGGDFPTLTTSHRSDPSLIKAVNTVFARQRAFVFEDIGFLPLKAARGVTDRLGGTATGRPPLQILFVSRKVAETARDGSINKGWADGFLPGAIASEIVRFLASGAAINGRSVEPSDIAVLCRTNRQAARMQVALRERGVPSVLQTEATVFEAPAAAEVQRVLRAMADPGDLRAIRAALATKLLGIDASALAELEHDEEKWEEWVTRFRAWHDLWLQRSFVVAFRAMLDSQNVRRRLLGLLDGERRLTDVLHLMELLHAASTEERRGPLALEQWLSEMRADPEVRATLTGEAAQIRLESDAGAVRLTTVHKSKGLEYPIVYCPFLWDGTLLRKEDTSAPRFHDPNDDNRLKLDIGSSAQEEHLGLAEREALAENLRLLYVALTRAKHRCSLVWGAFRSSETSALGYLLHQPPAASGDFETVTAARIEELIGSRDDAGMLADLQAVASAAEGAIEVIDLPPGSRDRYTPAAVETRPLQCRATTRQVSRTWRLSSFSALASSAARLSRPAEEGIDHDATERARGEHEPPAPSTAPSLVPLHEFPSGTRAGQLVHQVLQEIDFLKLDPKALRNCVTANLARFGFEEKWAEPLCETISSVLATPLDHGAEPFRLRDLSLGQRLNEMEFVFPVAGVTGPLSADAGRAPLTPQRLAGTFARLAAPPVPREYAERLAGLGFPALAGYMRGFIDLACEHAGRWYIFDYKSNYLGSRPEDYRPDRLLASMVEHHYFLQYHLYAVALHRHLERRLPGYHYDRHFGGIYYLFLRGMAPEHPGGNGVFYDRPSLALMRELSALLAGQGSS